MVETFRDDGDVNPRLLRREIPRPVLERLRGARTATTLWSRARRACALRRGRLARGRAWSPSACGYGRERSDERYE